MKSGVNPVYKGAVFLDRDGVLIEDFRLHDAYLTDADQVRLLPGAAEAVRELNEKNWAAIVVTNQAAVARGFITEEHLGLIHGRLEDLLFQNAGARLAAIYYCPFHPEGIIPRYARPSDSRKPGPGMLLQAAADLSLDLRRCYLVGDQESDMIAARRAGCRAIAVTTKPYGTNWNTWTEGIPDFVAGDLPVAVRWILNDAALASEGL